MEREGFYYKRDWLEALRVLPEQVKGEVNEAIVRYGISEELVPLKAMGQAVFQLIKADIDRDREEEAKRQVKSEKARQSISVRWGNVHTNVHTNVNTNVHTNVHTNDSHARTLDKNIIKEDNINKQPVNIEENKKKESGKKEKTKKSEANTLEERQQAFYAELTPYVETYGRDMVRAFFDYWSEPTQQRTKMRWQLEKTWDTKRRLGTWARRDEEFKQKPKGYADKPNSTAAERRDNATDIVRQLLDEND